MELMKKAYPDNDPVDLLRFLRARNLDIKDSREMYDNYLKWRSPSSKQPPGTITHADAEEQLSYNRFFLVTMMGDVQKDKVPLVYIVCRNHFPKYSTKKPFISVSFSLISSSKSHLQLYKLIASLI